MSLHLLPSFQRPSQHFFYYDFTLHKRVSRAGLKSFKTPSVRLTILTLKFSMSSNPHCTVTLTIILAFFDPFFYNFVSPLHFLGLFFYYFVSPLHSLDPSQWPCLHLSPPPPTSSCSSRCLLCSRRKKPENIEVLKFWKIFGCLYDFVKQVFMNS